MSIYDNWLTKVVDNCRKRRRFDRADATCIFHAIESAEASGQQFFRFGKASLTNAIHQGLNAAAESEKSEAAGKPSPAQACVLRMCELLAVEYSSLTDE